MALTVLMVTLCVAVFVANASILLAVRRLRTLKKVVAYFVNHLAVADILFGVCTLARSVTYIAESDSQLTCMLILGLVIISGGCGVTGILFLSLESYLSVRVTQQSPSALKKPRAVSMIALCWFFWVALAVASFVTQRDDVPIVVPCYVGNAYFSDTYVVCFCGVVFLHFACILYFQVGVIICLRKHFLQLRRNMAARRYAPKPQVTTTFSQASGHGQGTGRSSGSAGDGGSQLRLQQRWLQRQVSLTKLIALVCCLFCLCWYPTFVAVFWKAVCGGNCVSTVVIVYLALLILVHSFLNFVAYVVRSQEFRQVVKTLYCCCKTPCPPSQIAQIAGTRLNEDDTHVPAPSDQTVATIDDLAATHGAPTATANQDPARPASANQNQACGPANQGSADGSPANHEQLPVYSPAVADSEMAGSARDDVSTSVHIQSNVPSIYCISSGAPTVSAVDIDTQVNGTRTRTISAFMQSPDDSSILDLPPVVEA